MRLKHSVPTVLLLLSVGCQSKAEGMRVLCDVPVACPGCIESMDAGDFSQYQGYMQANLKNREVAEALVEMASNPPSERIAAMRKAAQDVGIDDCAFADYLARPIVVYPPGDSRR